MVEPTPETLKIITLEQLLRENPTVKIAYEFVKSAMEKHEPKLQYHGFHTHIIEVTNAAIFLAQQCGYDITKTAKIAIAAIYHDIGYVLDEDGKEIFAEKGHPARSAAIFRKFAEENPELFNDNEEIESLVQAIQNTDMQQREGRDFNSYILGDADFVILSYEQGFLERNRDLKNECGENPDWCMHELALGKEWNAKQAIFLSKVTFHTEYAKEHWEPRRQVNVAALSEFAEQTVSQR